MEKDRKNQQETRFSSWDMACLIRFYGHLLALCPSYSGEGLVNLTHQKQHRTNLKPGHEGGKKLCVK